MDIVHTDIERNGSTEHSEIERLVRFHETHKKEVAKTQIDKKGPEKKKITHKNIGKHQKRSQNSDSVGLVMSCVL